MANYTISQKTDDKLWENIYHDMETKDQSPHKQLWEISKKIITQKRKIGKGLWTASSRKMK